MAVPSPNISTSAPQGLYASMNDEIAEIWIQVQSRVRQLANGDSKKLNPNLGIDGVLSQLDRAQRSRESSSKNPKIRATFNNALQLIQSVGGVIGGGASEV